MFPPPQKKTILDKIETRLVDVQESYRASQAALIVSD